jgi:FMN reductase [NAD(P)H]
MQAMNETLRTIHQLRSIHGDFSEREISADDLTMILNAAVRAATASARQSYSIIVVEDKLVMREYLSYVGSKALLFCVDFTRIADTATVLGHPYEVPEILGFITGTTDTILAAQTAAIAAKSLGIDSLFTNSVHRLDLRELYVHFQLPERHCFPLISLILGYPRQEPKDHIERLTGPGVIHFDHYSRITREEAEEIVQSHDDPEEHLGMNSNWRELGYDHYLDWYYAAWDGSGFPPDKLSELYTVLAEAGFVRKAMASR